MVWIKSQFKMKSLFNLALRVLLGAVNTSKNNVHYRVDPRTSNGLMFEQLETQTKNSRKLEQKLESRTKNYVVVTWSPSLSAWSR